MQQLSVLSSEGLQTATAALLRAAGLEGDFSLQALPGGGNNQVFRVDRGSSRTLLKAYFQHPEDPRDRLGAEYSFCAFAWENGLRSLPQALARDRTNKLGLYEFIDGRKMLPEEADDGAIDQALTFFLEVNRYRHLPAARELPIASEAYFRMADHLECIERRLRILREIGPTCNVDREAADFVSRDLSPGWERVRGWVESGCRTTGLGLESEIPRGDRCLSPSDFGFHNAIRTPSGQIRFIDFEYSGWDDPAKMVCDFFCQVAQPILAKHLDHVVNSLAAGLPSSPEFRDRVALLMPVYRVKWCCIVLNEFVRVSSNRRHFANSESLREDKKAKQLAKARGILRSVTDERGIHGIR